MTMTTSTTDNTTVHDTPIVPAIPTSRGGQLKMWCPYCRAWHHHGRGSGKPGSGDGARVAHCTNLNSPYHMTGYYLKEVRASEQAVKRQAQGLPARQSEERHVSGSNQVRAFLGACTMRVAGAAVSDGQLYARYIEWCISEGIAPIRKTDFREWLQVFKCRMVPRHSRAYALASPTLHWRDLSLLSDRAPEVV